MANRRLTILGIGVVICLFGCARTLLPKAELNKRLVVAANEGRIADLRELLDMGADANLKDEKGTPLISTAAANGQADLVAALIGKKADVEARNSSGFTPLMHAVKNGRTETARVLLLWHADPNAKSPMGQTVLDIAKTRGDAEMVSLLNDKGARGAGTSSVGQKP